MACPRCGQQLRPDGGYDRQVRTRDGRRHRLWVHRGRCPRCAVSHALLPEFVVAHHLDTADTIGAALVGAAHPALPASTLAGWRRRWRANGADVTLGAAAAHVVFSGEVLAGDQSSSTPAVITALWLAARARFGASASPWRLLNIITGTSWMARRVNSSWVGVGLVPVAARAP